MPDTNNNPNPIGDFWTSIMRDDTAAAKDAIMTMYNACPNKTADCLNKIFCPACPMANQTEEQT